MPWMLRARSSVRNLTVAAISLAVVGVLVAFVVSSPKHHMTPHMRGAIAEPSLGASAAVFGVVRDKGGPLSGVDVVALPAEGRSAPNPSTMTASDGTYRVELEPGSYHLTFSCRCHDEDLVGSIDVTLRSGHAYRVDAELRDGRTFLVVPVSSY